MAEVANLIIDKYATFEAEFIYSDNTGTPIDLTGYTAKMQIRSAPNGGTVLDTFTSPSTGIVLGTTDGTIVIKITATATGGYTWSSGVYDLVLTDPTGDKNRFVEGTVIINPGVTQ